MKKYMIKMMLIAGLVSFQIDSALANGDSCFVIGTKEPNSNTYNGPTFCGAVTLANIIVRGPLQLKNTEIKGLTRVSGPIKASGASLQNLILENNHSLEKVYLQSGTVVNGDIVFEGREGMVYVDGSSYFKGKVFNGKVITNRSLKVSHENRK